jgi:hypothetical protein
MKKKFLLPGIAVFMALAILLAGCPQPSDTVITGDSYPLVKLDDPTVRVTVYEGFNVISWEPVRDASGYQVWRTDTQSSSQVHIGGRVGKNTNLSIVDDVADTSTITQRLVNGRTYKYIVVAIPDSSRVGSPTQAQFDLYSGKGEATVTANIPDPATYKVPKASDIKYRVNPDGTLYVSWTQPANASATVGYFPGYPMDASQNLSDSTFVNLFTSSGPSSNYLFTNSEAGYLYPRNAAHATFPIIGGKATIAIRTEYLSSNTMYVSDDIATLDITLDQYDLSLGWKSGDLSASHIYEGADKGKVQLSWPRVEGDESTYSSDTYAVNGVTYNLYRALAPVSSRGAIIGAWEKVDYVITNSIEGSNLVYAVEKNVTDASLGSYVYMVYATAQKGSKTTTSYPKLSNLARNLPNQGMINAVSIAQNGLTTAPYSIAITVNNLVEGVSYSLYRGELKPILKDSNGKYITPYVGTSPFVPLDDVLDYQFIGYSDPIHTWTGQLSGGDNAVIYDTGANVKIRTAYRYKLVSKMGETLLGEGYAKDLTPTQTLDPTSVYTNLTLTMGAPDATVADNDAKFGSFTATLSNNGYSKELQAKLFYAPVPPTGSGSTNLERLQWKQFDAPFIRRETGTSLETTDAGGQFMKYEFQLTTDLKKLGEKYYFKAIAYDKDGTELPNTSNDSFTDISIPTVVTQGKTSSTITTLSQPSITGGVLTAPGFVLGTTNTSNITGVRGNYLNTAKINVRLIRTTETLGVQNVWEQDDATFGRANPFNAALPEYKVDVTLTQVPAASTPPVNYTVQWKWPWEDLWKDLATGLSR